MKLIILIILFTVTLQAQTTRKGDNITFTGYLKSNTSQDTDTIKSNWVSVAGTKNIYFSNTQIYPISSITFGNGANFSITWKNGNLEILYGKETKPSEAVKQFFDWLKKYIEQDYYVIQKDSLNKLLRK